VNHQYIDEHSLAERYLHHTLAPAERAEFEAHLVDCAECTDRLLLAEMFHVRNGKSSSPALNRTEVFGLPEEQFEMPWRAQFVARLTPWQLLLIAISSAILLLLIPSAYLLWEVHQLRP
jgi:Putative zinc-finger